MNWFANVCAHDDGWADQAPNAFGNRVCASCGAEVFVVMTEAGLKTSLNRMATSFGFARVFDEID